MMGRGDYPGLAAAMQGPAKGPPPGYSFAAYVEQQLWALSLEYAVCKVPKGRQLILAAVGKAGSGEWKQWEEAWLAAGKGPQLPADAVEGLTETAARLQQEYSQLAELPRSARRRPAGAGP